MVVLVVGVEDNYITKISREKTMVVIHFTKTWGNRLLLRVPWGDWSNSMRMKFPWVAPLWWSVKGVPMESGTKGSPQFHQNASDKTLNVPLQTPPPLRRKHRFHGKLFQLNSTNRGGSQCASPCCLDSVCLSNNSLVCVAMFQYLGSL